MNVHSKSLAEVAKIKAETAKIRAETAKTMASMLFEATKVGGIVVSLLLAAWANCTKADDSKVEAAAERTDTAIGTLSENVEAQHKQSEKLRETMEGTTEAVRAVASAAANGQQPSIPISDGPVDNGCWTVYGGIVKCKVDSAASAASMTPLIRVEVPEPPPPAPPLKKVDERLRQ